MSKWTKSATIKNFYKFYTYRKSPNHEKYLTNKQYTQIVKDLFSGIEEMLFEGETYDIPWGLGEIRINKYKCSGKPRNYKQEKIHFERTGEWKEIYYQNFHTDGYRMKIGWYKRGDVFRNRNFYSFEPNKRMKKRFAEILKNTGDVSKFYYFNKKMSNHLKHVKTLV